MIKHCPYPRKTTKEKIRLAKNQIAMTEYQINWSKENGCSMNPYEFEELAIAKQKLKTLKIQRFLPMNLIYWIELKIIKLQG